MIWPEKKKRPGIPALRAPETARPGPEESADFVAGIAAALIVFRFSNGGWPEIDWTHVVFIVAAIFVIYKVSAVIRKNLPTPEEYAQRKKKE